MLTITGGPEGERSRITAAVDGGEAGRVRLYAFAADSALRERARAAERAAWRALTLSSWKGWREEGEERE